VGEATEPEPAMIELHRGDCLEVMQSITDCSVDLILTDLPFGVTACGWDQVIPFEPLWAQYKRLLKPRGTVVLTASQPFTTDLIQSQRGWFRYTVVWEKSNGTNFLNARYQPMKVHEDIVIFSPAASTYSRRGSMTYNPQMQPGSLRNRKPGMRSVGNLAFHTAPGFHAGESNKTTRYPRSVIRFPGVNDAQLERVGHGTQKPVALMEYLVKTYSNECDTVLDSCMGSGTTLVACLNTNRHGIGIEKDPEIFATAENRIAAELNKTPLLAGS
jgi:site-specific DNA-methyltransferase (adenine-specific)